MRGERVCVGDVGGVHGGERGIGDDAGGADCGRAVREHDGGGIVQLAAGIECAAGEQGVDGEHVGDGDGVGAWASKLQLEGTDHVVWVRGV